MVEWLAKHEMSPLTGEALSHTSLVPNVALRGLIREYVEQKGRDLGAATQS